MTEVIRLTSAQGEYDAARVGGDTSALKVFGFAFFGFVIFTILLC